MKFDYIIISNPTSEHKKTIDEFINLKIPLFIEKPVSNTLDFQDTIVKIEKYEILTYVACNLRFLEALQFVKENVDIRKINEVNVYCGSYLPDWRSGTDFRTSYSVKKELGGGVHIDLIHEIDYIYWLFGVPSKVTKILRNTSSLQIEAVDYANYCLEYRDFCVSIILNYYRRDYKRTLEILFDDYTWNVDLQRNSIEFRNEEIFKSEQKISDTYLSQMQYFYSILNTSENTSINTIQEAYQVLQIVI